MLVCLIFKDLLLERAVGMSEVCVELVGKLVGEMLGLSKEELSESPRVYRRLDSLSPMLPA